MWRCRLRLADDFAVLCTNPTPLKALLCCWILVLLIGCGVRERTQQVYDEWGRASLQGEASRGGEIGIAARSDGSLVMLAWFGRNPQNDEILQIQTINEQNEIVATFPIALGGQSPSDLQLIAHADEVLAAWIVQSGSWRVLRVLSVGWEGVSGAIDLTISAENSDTRWHTIKPSNNDTSHIFWLDGNNILHGERLQNNRVERIFDQSNVSHADFVESADGTLQIIWVSDENLLNYTQLPPNRPRLRSARALTSPIAEIDNLTLAIDQSHAYTAWRDSSSQIFYTTFPLPDIIPTDLVNSVPISLTISTHYPPARFPAQSTTYPYTQLSNATGDITISPSGLTTRYEQTDEAVFVTTVRLQTNNRQQSQPVLVYLRDGEIHGYQTLTWTGNNSGKVAVSADQNNHLYLAWLVIQRGDKPVYLITTQPTLRDAMSDLVWGDYWIILIGGIGRMLQAFRLLPLVLPWLLMPMFYFFLVVAIMGGNTAHWRARNAFLLGIIVYEIVKFWFGLRGDVALLRFIPNVGLLTPNLAQLLIYTIPLVTLTSSIFLTWLLYIRRVREVVHSTWFILVILLDHIISLTFYAIAFFA